MSKSDYKTNPPANNNFSSIADVFKGKPKVKPPAYPWQELALQVIKELNIPNFKRSAVFKVCRDLPRQQILIALNDTKELATPGSAWRYFFKIVEQRK